MAEKNDKADKAVDKDFTDRELEIMAKAWMCMEGEPKVDYKKLAEATGMTNDRSASNAWAKIKKKIMAKGGVTKKSAKGEDGEDETPKAKPKATPKRKKAATATAGADDEDDNEEASPTKKTKGAKGRGKQSESKAEEDGDETPVKKEDLEDGELQED